MSTRQVHKTFRNDQLVLCVSETVDPEVWNESRYAAFLDALCGPREYQKRAIKTVLRFLIGGHYQSLSQLAEENFNASDDIKERYGTFRQMEQHLLLPDRLYSTLDLATGTGKSYVLYGLATIMLAEGHVDQVLVLCPSNTIEGGLIEKFSDLAARTEIRDSLPDGAACRTPSIIRGNQSITKDSICVENYHAVLEHVRSSIRESLAGKGARTLVLNDEIHHVQSEPDAAQKRWREFLADREMGFRWLVGVSGTCYVKDEYFGDVVSRYSLRQAVEDGVVKSVDYVDDSDVGNNVNEQNQVIYDNHKKNKATYGLLKPLTIVVTKNISACEQIAEEWIDFLAEHEKIDREKAAEKVLVVTSAAKHAPNLAKLKTVDSSASKIEWIFSVSMLSEGWDVKNVFQIVPHEERAFNSKLLISQVLGRGLRVPPQYPGKQVVVTVFNHESWSSKIRHLVDEILELEKRIVCRIDPEKPFHFDLHQIDYTREAATKTYKQDSAYNLLKKGYVDLPSQSESINRTVEYTRVGTEESHARVTTVRVKMYTVDDVARHVHLRLRGIDEESSSSEDPKQRTSYSTKYDLSWCKDMVRRSLREAGEKEDQVSEENRQKILQSLGPLYRGAAKAVRYQLKPKHVRIISTRDRQASSLSISAFQDNEATFFYTASSGRVLREEELSVFQEATSEDSELPRKSTVQIANEFHFKSPLNLVFSTHEPERKFIRKLIDPQNAAALDAWVKSADRDFYSIEFSWKTGEHTKRGGFNPDFFIKKGSKIYVIEVKDEGQVRDPDEENRKKYEFGKEHFDRLNQEQTDITYQFHFLSPIDFDAFLQRLRADDLDGYQSHLDVALRA